MSTYAARRAHSLKLAKSEDAALLLESFMSEISELHYCAGWLIGLEFSLWSIMTTYHREFGLGPVSEANVARLRELHERAGGWWHWVDVPGNVMDSGEQFIPTAAWEAIYAADKPEAW